MKERRKFMRIHTAGSNTDNEMKEEEKKHE
jgi:hypothetical protein